MGWKKFARGGVVEIESFRAGGWKGVKLMKIKTKSALKTFANGAELEEVEDFKYLGSYISANGSMEKEIATRIAMAAQAFNRLAKIWKSSSLQQRTKIRIYKSNVRSVHLLIYSCRGT